MRLPDRPFVSVRQAAKLLHLAPPTVKSLVQQGVLEGYQVPGGKRLYITLASVQRLLLGKEEPPRGGA